jgi:hypothetical protein
MNSRKTTIKKLKVRRRQLRKLASADMEAVQGGNFDPHDISDHDGLSLHMGSGRVNHNQLLRDA